MHIEDSEQQTESGMAIKDIKLTKPQAMHLKRIGSFICKDRNFPHAGYFDSIPERNLVKMGLIRWIKIEKPLGGNAGSISKMSVVWNFACLTELGLNYLNNR